MVVIFISNGVVVFINTFVDVVIHTQSDDYISEKLLVLNKYYDSNNNPNVIDFNKRFNVPVGTDILSSPTIDIKIPGEHF